MPNHVPKASLKDLDAVFSTKMGEGLQYTVEIQDSGKIATPITTLLLQLNSELKSKKALQKMFHWKPYKSVSTLSSSQPNHQYTYIVHCAV